MRHTNEGFAEILGTSTRTVAKWNAEPDLVPMPELQRALDTLFATATPQERERFASLVDSDQGDSTATRLSAALASCTPDA
jgi:hypothetical protein